MWRSPEDGLSEHMKTAIIQSNYIPWKGYFDIINEVDVFICIDCVQYTTRDWRNRNKIKTKDGLKWLTVPVHGNRRQKICEVTIDYSGNFVATHLETLKRNYVKTPFFQDFFPVFKECLSKKYGLLSDLNMELIKLISSYLGIETKIISSIDLKAEGRKDDRLIDICKKIGASSYLSGPSAKSYIDCRKFEEASINIEFKEYVGYPEYPQQFDPFEHYISILDLIFNTGKDAPYYIWGWRDKCIISTQQ